MNNKEVAAIKKDIDDLNTQILEKKAEIVSLEKLKDEKILSIQELVKDELQKAADEYGFILISKRKKKAKETPPAAK